MYEYVLVFLSINNIDNLRKVPTHLKKMAK